MASSTGKESVAVCGVCRDIIHSGGTGDEEQPLEAYAMLCSHTYHSVCIKTWSSTRGLPMAKTPCPQCKKTAEDFEGLADEPDSPEIIIPGGERASSSGHPQNFSLSIDLADADDDIETVPDADARHSPSPKAKAKAKGKAKLTPKVKAKAKSKVAGEVSVQEPATEAVASSDVVNESGGDAAEGAENVEHIAEQQPVKAKAKAKAKPRVPGTVSVPEPALGEAAEAVASGDVVNEAGGDTVQEDSTTAAEVAENVEHLANQPQAKAKVNAKAKSKVAGQVSVPEPALQEATEAVASGDVVNESGGDAVQEGTTTAADGAGTVEDLAEQPPVKAKPKRKFKATGKAKGKKKRKGKGVASVSASVEITSRLKKKPKAKASIDVGAEVANADGAMAGSSQSEQIAPKAKAKPKSSAKGTGKASIPDDAAENVVDADLNGGNADEADEEEPETQLALIDQPKKHKMSGQLDIYGEMQYLCDSCGRRFEMSKVASIAF